MFQKKGDRALQKSPGDVVSPAVLMPERVADEDTDNLLKLAAGLGRLGAWSVELADRALTWSDEVCAILDLPARHRPTFEEGLRFAAPEYRAAVRAAFDRCAQCGHPYDLQVQAVTARGRRIWVRAIGQPGYDEHGHIVRVHGAFQDITSLVQVHEEKRQLAERLTVTLESLTDGFYVLDHQWRFTYLNAEAARVMGICRRESLGKVLWDLFPEAVETVFYREFERALAENVSIEVEGYYEPLDLWVQLRASPSSFGLAVSFRDITKRKRAEQQVRRLNAELEDRVQRRTAELRSAMKDLEMFAYAVAHDLRTPMCAGKAFTRALQATEQCKLSGQGTEYLQKIQDALQYMDDMTVSLLGLAKLSNAPLRREAVDLSAIATKILDVQRVATPARDVKVSVQDGLLASADRTLVAEVLMNLIGNAWKFTRGRKKARIEVGARNGASGDCVFYVKDNGPGFAMHAAERLFDPFVRLDTEVEGSGIGLATVHKIVTRHGGRVWAKAAVGRGACFFFTLPDT